MILFPAIDLLGGRVVRLQRGDRSKVDVYSDDPVGVAEEFYARGARWVHVVDLSSAFEEDRDSRERNHAAIAAICQIQGMGVDVGGGVRDIETVARLASLGASRIAIGTALVRDPEFAKRAAREYGDLVVADVASRDGIVRVNGWREGSGLTTDELVAHLGSLGFHHLVYTDVSRDGMRTGIYAPGYEHIAAVAGFPVVASGGIRSLTDIYELQALGDSIVEGAIVGRALYEGEFTLEEALAAAQGKEVR